MAVKKQRKKAVSDDFPARYFDIIRRPVITEKWSAAKEEENVLCFEVDPRADKVEIRNAVERLFSVKVTEVRTQNCLGKVKRMGRSVGRRPDTKRAYVKLAPGEKKIEYFEGV